MISRKCPLGSSQYTPRPPSFVLNSPGRRLNGSAEYLVELSLADEECVVLWIRRAVVVGEIERDIVVNLHDEKRTERCGFGEAEDLGQESGRLLLVPDADDRMVQLDAHQTDGTRRRSSPESGHQQHHSVSIGCCYRPLSGVLDWWRDGRPSGSHALTSRRHGECP